MTRSTTRTTAPSRLTTLALLAAALVAALLATLATAGPAAAASYRYWGYFQGASGTWEFAQTGPDDYQVVDQDVQGWRFGISSETTTPLPDNAPDFATLCPDLAAGSAPAGEVRVAVVIDSGLAADAPEGQTPPADEISCVTVPAGSTGSQTLSRAATVASQDSLVCSINAFPAGECGSPVSDADAAAAAAAGATESPNPATPGAASAAASDAPTSSGSSSAVPLIIGGLVVVAVLLGVLFTAGRRRGTPDEG